MISFCSAAVPLGGRRKIDLDAELVGGFLAAGLGDGPEFGGVVADEANFRFARARLQAGKAMRSRPASSHATMRRGFMVRRLWVQGDW